MDIELSIETKESGEVAVKRLPLSGRLALGRGPESPVLLDGTGVSREHIVFEPAADGVTLTDLSANGTWINGQRIKAGLRYPVTEAHQITIPGYDFRFVLLGAPKPEPPPASTDKQPSISRNRLPQLSGFEWVTGVFLALAIVLVVIFLRL